MSFPDLCCAEKYVATRLLVLSESELDYPEGYFSPTLILPPTKDPGPEEGDLRRFLRERRLRAARYAALLDLVEKGVAQREPTFPPGAFRLAPSARGYYARALRTPTFTRVRGSSLPPGIVSNAGVDGGSPSTDDSRSMETTDDGDAPD